MADTIELNRSPLATTTQTTEPLQMDTPADTRDTEMKVLTLNCW